MARPVTTERDERTAPHGRTPDDVDKARRERRARKSAEAHANGPAVGRLEWPE